MKDHTHQYRRSAAACALMLGLLATTGAVQTETAKNIILLISDGCGYSHVDAATIYQYGAPGRQVYEQFPVGCGMRTTALLDNGQEMKYEPELVWKNFTEVMKYFTDSSASATAMSCGTKTVNGALGVDRQQRPLKHVAEQAEDLGKSVGLVTSVQWCHATPAGFVAHNSSRGNYAEIAREMLLDSRCEVIMGCGHPLFNDDGQPAPESDFTYVAGPSIWAGLVAGQTDFDTDGDGAPDKTVADIDDDGTADPWTLIQAHADFQWLQAGPTPKRVLGIPQVRSTLQYNRGGSGSYEPAGDSGERPYSTPLVENVPTLAEMTRGALNVLDNDPDGFFLMVEGGAVDWAAHGHNEARLIEEEIDFNQAVECAVKWVEERGAWDQTLVIVTGDHETGYLTGPGSGLGVDASLGGPAYTWHPLVSNGPGQMPGMEWHSDNHTNSLIPLYARGPGSQYFQDYVEGTDPVRGPYIDNTAVAKVVGRCLEPAQGD